MTGPKDLFTTMKMDRLLAEEFAKKARKDIKVFCRCTYRFVAGVAQMQKEFHDEFVQMLSGKIILTDASGKRAEFVAGDSLVVPKGFTGTWQMLGNYRGLVVIDRAAYDKAYGAVAE